MLGSTRLGFVHREEAKLSGTGSDCNGGQGHSSYKQILPTVRGEKGICVIQTPLFHSGLLIHVNGLVLNTYLCLCWSSWRSSGGLIIASVPAVKYLQTAKYCCNQTGTPRHRWASPLWDPHQKFPLKLWFTPEEWGSVQCLIPYPSIQELWSGRGDTPGTFQGLEVEFITASKLSSFTGAWTKRHGVGRAGNRQGKATSDSHFQGKLLFQQTPFNPPWNRRGSGRAHSTCFYHGFWTGVFDTVSKLINPLCVYLCWWALCSASEISISALGLFYFPIVKMKDWLNNFSSACQALPFSSKSSSSDSHH